MRSYWSTLLIYMVDMYYTRPNMKETGIRIGEKSLRMDGTDTEREPKLIFWFVNCRLVRSQTLEKVWIVALNLRHKTCHTLKNVLQFGVPIYIIHLAMTMNGPDRSKKYSQYDYNLLILVLGFDGLVGDRATWSNTLISECFLVPDFRHRDWPAQIKSKDL